MLLKKTVFVYLLLIERFYQPILCVLPQNIKNIELDNIISSSDEFPVLIDKIEQTINRFNCPKGWKRLGGSCYYFSNVTSTLSHVNRTCYDLHSNHSNLMQIRNGVAFLYALHVLTRNNLSSLMIELDSSLLIGKRTLDILPKDSGQLKNMKEALQKVRIKYQNSTRKIIDRLNSIGLRISRRSKQIKDNEYEYDDFNSTDEFEQMENIEKICDEIHWDGFDSIRNTTTFILSTYYISNRTICSLSDVETNTTYHHVCEYVLDYCFANIICGKHGQCENALKGFKCACSLLYGGFLCEKICEHGYHIIICGVIIVILKIVSEIVSIRKGIQSKIKELLGSKTENEPPKTQTPQYGFQEFVEELRSMILTNPSKRDLAHHIWIVFLTIVFLSLLLFGITIINYQSSGYHRLNEDEHFSLNNTIPLMSKCANIFDYRQGNIVFAPFACILIFLFSWLTKRDTLCLNTCDGRPGIIPPIEPYGRGKRLTTASVFGIIAFEIFKIFGDLLFNTGKSFKHLILYEIMLRIVLVILIGLRYYPVLASLQSRNVVVRCLACCYIIANIGYTIVREGVCMDSLPFPEEYAALEVVNLRINLGTWLLIYALIKNIPHFALLSYIGAELHVRFVYDSIYRPLRKAESIWSTPAIDEDELNIGKYYVIKLLRRNRDQKREKEIKNLIKQSTIKKFIGYFYPFGYYDDGFRFTTMTTCAYTVAIIFLYYLTCTIVFLYITRTTGHISFLKSYLETAYNLDLEGYSFKTEIIVSAVFTGLFILYQLWTGMQRYKKHMILVYQKIEFEIVPPTALESEPTTIATNAVHYPGLLVGYMAWSFIICFHVILLITIPLGVLRSQIRKIDPALSIVVPILMLYIFKKSGMKFIGEFSFLSKSEDGTADLSKLKNRKVYAIFVYFIFLADCFLGITSCLIRLFKAMIIHVLYMVRLDCSFIGRPLERYDFGFEVYVSYLYMETAHSNPVLFAFCYTLYEDILKRRRKQPDADKYSTTSSELASDVENPQRNEIRNSRTIADHRTENSTIQNEEYSVISNKIEEPSDFPPPVPPRADLSSSENLNENTTVTHPTIENNSSSQHSKSITSARPGTFHEQERWKVKNIHTSLNNSANPANASSHCSEMTDNVKQSAVTNPLYSLIGSAHNISNGTTGEVSEDETSGLLENRSTFVRIQSNSRNQSEQITKERIKRQKLARFRWHLLYTLIRNYHLFDLRKNLSARVISIVQQTSGLNKQSTNLKVTYPPSSPEIHIAGRAEQLYPEAYEKQQQSTNVVHASSTPTNTVKLGTQPRSGLVTGRSSRSRKKQTSTLISPQEVQQVHVISPKSQPAPSSNQTTVKIASNENYTTYDASMNFDQRLQRWRQEQIKKIQKKNRYLYAYDVLASSTISDNMSNPILLKQQVPIPPISITEQFERSPTTSPSESPPSRKASSIPDSEIQ